MSAEEPRPPKRRLPRWLDALLGLLLLPVVLFEEWGWDALHALAAWLARVLRLQALERWLTRLPPYGALAVLLVPSIAILPIKLLGVWLLAQGQWLASLLLVGAAKIAGTAVLARLFALLKPQLMTIGWFARGFSAWTAWKERWLVWLRATALWQAAHRQAQALSAALRRWRRG